MPRRRTPLAVLLALVLCALTAVPVVAQGQGTTPARSSRPLSADTGPTATSNSSVPRPLLLLLAAAALVATAGAIWQERGSPRAFAHGRVVRRRRREVGTLAYRVARHAGFRYSRSRNALVLRGVGGRLGPVLRLRSDLAPLPRAAPPPMPAPTAAAQRPTEADAAGRLVDLACLPLPSAGHGRLWQLTAVDVGSRFTWTELVRPRGAMPAPEQTLAFVQRIATQLDARGLTLEAVVVQAGSTHRRTLATAVELADVRLLRTLPGPRRHPLAAQRHQQIVGEHWNQVLPTAGAPGLDALERELQRWTELGNEAAGTMPGDGRSPFDALGGAPHGAGAAWLRAAARDETPPVLGS